MNYHHRPEVSASMLKSMAQGWRQFEAEYITKAERRKETAAMALGTAIHCALLEPQRLKRDYVVCPESCSDRRTKAYKEWASTVTESQTVLTADDNAILKAACEAVMRDKAASAALSQSGQVESETFWTDRETGVACRMKSDLLLPSIVVDIKTTDDARPQAFAATIGKYRYDLQAVHYLEGTGRDCFVFIAVETSSPYRVRCYELGESDLSAARDRRLQLLREYQSRMISGDWSEDGENNVTKLFIPNYLAL